LDNSKKEYVFERRRKDNKDKEDKLGQGLGANWLIRVQNEGRKQPSFQLLRTPGKSAPPCGHHATSLRDTSLPLEP